MSQSFTRRILANTSRRVFSTTPNHTITMFTKEGCSLCVPVKEAILYAQSEYNGLFKYEEVDITAPEHKDTWWKMYKYDIPVVHLNGTEIARHFLDPEDLFEKLDAIPKQ